MAITNLTEPKPPESLMIITEQRRFVSLYAIGEPYEHVSGTQKTTIEKTTPEGYWGQALQTTAHPSTVILEKGTK
jgi:hypothetical protein